MTQVEQNRLPALKGKKVLITGGLGFIGSNLAHKCVELGADVTIYDMLDPRSGGNMRNLIGIEDSVKVTLNDIRNFEGLSSAILRQDILFNCAAYTSHPNSMKEPQLDIDVNCKGVINILEAARRFNRDIKIVQVSTSTQIGRMLTNPVDENHPEFPLDIYSANKSVSEKYVLVYGNAYGLDATVIRLANVFGPRSNIRTPDFGFMNYFVGLGLQGKRLTIFGSGAQLRNISFVDDCVVALVMAAERGRGKGEVFFATADRQCNVSEIANAIVKVFGKGEVVSVEWPKERAVIEIGDIVISNRKIKERLGWSPRHSLEEGLRKTQAYFEPCLEHYLGH